MSYLVLNQTDGPPSSGPGSILTSGPSSTDDGKLMAPQMNVNKPSTLLSDRENLVVFDILGVERHTLSTAVAQLLLPAEDDQTNWEIQGTGVVCFVRDRLEKSYFIIIYSLKTNTMVYRQEIYTEFQFKMPQPMLLTYEGDDSVVGLNFADVTEATSFRDALDAKLETKRKRRNDRRSRLMENRQSKNYSCGVVRRRVQPEPAIEESSQLYAPRMSNDVTGTGMPFMTSASNYMNNPVTTTTTTKTTTTSIKSLPSIKEKKDNKKGPAKKGDRSSKDQNKKPKLRKEDIGTPSDFRHVQHVGWNSSDKEFHLDGADKDLQSFFEKVGISGDQLHDENTREFIYNFINENGGVEAVKNEIGSAYSGGQGDTPHYVNKPSDRKPVPVPVQSSMSTANYVNRPPDREIVPVPAPVPAATGNYMNRPASPPPCRSAPSSPRPGRPPPPKKLVNEGGANNFPPPRPSGGGASPTSPSTRPPIGAESYSAAPPRPTNSGAPPRPPTGTAGAPPRPPTGGAPQRPPPGGKPVGGPPPPPSAGGKPSRPPGGGPPPTPPTSGSGPPPPPPMGAAPPPPPFVPLDFGSLQSDSGFPKLTPGGGGGGKGGAGNGGGGGGDGGGITRSALLDQIQGGIKLKKVADQVKIGGAFKPGPGSAKPASSAGGLAEALARALNERSGAVQYSDDENTSGDDFDIEDDDEWDE